MKYVLVVGLGEVGSAIYNIVEDRGHFQVQGIDKEPKKVWLPKIDVMHICFPYSIGFKFIISWYIEKFDPKLTIINSTVLPGTTNQIYESTRKPICHSPIRGRHIEGLETGIRGYTKFIGAPKYEFAVEAAEHFNSLGIKTIICKSSLETEFMKILATSYYGLMIAFTQEMRRICEKHQVSESDIKYFFLSGNVESNFKHLHPVYYPGVIGGHCILSNLKMLKELYESKFIDFIFESNRKQKSDLK